MKRRKRNRRKPVLSYIVSACCTSDDISLLVLCRWLADERSAPPLELCVFCFRRLFRLLSVSATQLESFHVENAEFPSRAWATAALALQEHSFRVDSDDDGRAVCSLSRVPSSSFECSPAFVIRNENSVNFNVSLMIFPSKRFFPPRNKSEKKLFHLPSCRFNEVLDVELYQTTNDET